MMGMLQQNEELKISEFGGHFQILTHNYQQTNGIQLECFYTSFTLEILKRS